MHSFCLVQGCGAVGPPPAARPRGHLLTKVLLVVGLPYSCLPAWGRPGPSQAPGMGLWQSLLGPLGPPAGAPHQPLLWARERSLKKRKEEQRPSRVRTAGRRKLNAARMAVVFAKLRVSRNMLGAAGSALVLFTDSTAPCSLRGSQEIGLGPYCILK